MGACIQRALARLALGEGRALEGMGEWIEMPAADLGGVDLVVLDPPRSGAGRDVVAAVTATAPRAVAYVACDPVALARDLAFFAADGYALTAIPALHAFPMTHHAACLPTLSSAGRPSSQPR